MDPNGRRERAKRRISASNRAPAGVAQLPQFAANHALTRSDAASKVGGVQRLARFGKRRAMTSGGGASTLLGSHPRVLGAGLGAA